jgi:hypothetical protein
MRIRSLGRRSMIFFFGARDVMKEYDHFYMVIDF